MKKIALAMAVMFAAFTATAANVGMNITSDNITFDGGSNYAEGDYFMFLIDVNGDGIAAPTDSDFTPGADDYLAADGNAAYVDMDGFRGYAFTGDLQLDETTYGDKDVWLVALDETTDADAAPGEGKSYVMWRDSAMTLPSASPSSLTGNYTFDYAQATSGVTGSPIPEPTTMLGMLILGAGAFLTNRRRSRN